MEPTIYKPGTYKTPGVYKGAGGIYNGLGVYNTGDEGGGGYIPLNFVQMGSLLWDKVNLNVDVADEFQTIVNWPNGGKLYSSFVIENGELENKIGGGWRIPTVDDFESLIKYLYDMSFGGAPNRFAAIAIDNSSYNYYYNSQYIYNPFGFDALITGFGTVGNDNIRNYRFSCNFWTKTNVPYMQGNFYNYCLEDGSSFVQMNHPTSYKLCVRICKDA